ncbi:MAG: hypothetical protein DMG78_01665 [Acidobacteria bacterium]|nr:MAG: hypothetical protein DMG78_01665 [Acidobacteriota bacterium]
MTDAIKRKLQEEINALEHELIHELPKEIKKAAALGDLSENAEYHMAKQRQEFVKARVRQLGKRLADLSMVNMNNIPRDKVGLGSTVKVYDNTKGEEVEYKLVTSEESDVAAGKISTTSPIGRALLNKKVGDEAVVVSPNGKRELEILSLSTIHDEIDGPKEAQKAAALGDLSENAEYHMAKQRQEFVKARVRQLGKRLADLSMVNMNNIPRDKVGLGSTVKVYDNTKGEEVEYKLVTSEESDVAAGKISTTSPIGRALLNKKVGDEAVVVSPNGKRELEILSLSTIHDEIDGPKEAQA